MISRRALFGATAATGVAAVATACGSDATGTSAGASSTEARFISARGKHQAGITTPSPEHAIVAAFRVTATNRADLETMFKALSAEIDVLTAGTTEVEAKPLYPPTDNMILGAKPFPDDLTVTVGVGASLFDSSAGSGLEDRKPKQLRPMTGSPNDQLDSERIHGDVVLQICARGEDTCVHALRRLMRVTRAGMTLAWMMPGFQRPNTLGPGRASTRNLLGFKDGTANPDPNSAKLMDELVWVQPGRDEPAWAVGGSYLVARIIRMKVEFWDRTPLHTQEAIFGRHKDTGAPLDSESETDVPNYADDPDGKVIPMTAHMRLANPRTGATEKNRILRRGFSYSMGFNSAGQLDQGLLFVCYQRDLDEGFVKVQERLDGEALEEYITPVGGGFFFALPGASERSDDWVGRTLFA